MTESTTKADPITTETLDKWATDTNGPVALHLKQRLVSVGDLDGKGGIVFPPTYADIGYNIDTLADGTKVATIDSVGSQGNRLEPIFKAEGSDRANWLVPQIDIVLRSEPCGECEACKKDQKRCTKKRDVKRSLLDLAHRAADAVVQSSPTLQPDIARAFAALAAGDASPLCTLAPTSLVFGVWDSRGEGEKRPRLVRSIIRAWDVQPLHSAAQFNSGSKALSKEDKEQLKAEEAKPKRAELSEAGLADAPSVWRKTKARQFYDYEPNPEARVLGGVLAGRIEREVTVNLVALRGLRGKDPKATAAIRKYMLGLSLVVSTADIDMFLREGCQLRYASDDSWYEIPRRGDPRPVALGTEASRKNVSKYALEAAKHFRGEWPTDAGLVHRFDVNEAKKLLAKKVAEEAASASQTG